MRLSFLTFGTIFLAAAPLAAQNKTAAAETAQAALNATSGAPSSAASKPTEVVYCGGETTRTQVRQFFRALRKGLEQKSLGSYYNRFLAETFGVTRNGRYLRYNKGDFNAATPRFFSTEDWEAIAKRGERGLESVGWRGCMMDHGKVWFQSDENGLRLTSINHDMAWVELD